MRNAEDVNILLVEDDELDVRAVRREFRRRGITNPVFVASDGVEGLEYLRGEAGRERLDRPYVILLDLRMPRMNGIQFLREIRQDPQLHNSIVFVVTTSDSETDKDEAYKLNVAGYVLKSDLKPSSAGAVDMFQSFFDCVEFPVD